MADVIEVDTASRLYTRLEAAHRGDSQALSVRGVELAGDVGGDGGPGLWSAVRRFLERHREWSVVSVSRESSGTVVVSRDPADKPDLPSIATQAWNYLKVKVGEFWRGRKLVSDELFQLRLSHCWVCPYRVDSRCTKCGCYLDRVADDAPVDAGAPGKAARESEHCPVGHW